MKNAHIWLAAAIALIVAVFAILLWNHPIFVSLDDGRQAALYQPFENLQLYTDAEPGVFYPYCDRPPTREDAGLCAQWAAVSAAEEANRLSRINLHATLIQWLALIIGLGLSAWAAYAASKAAGAAEAGIEEAKRTAREQLRAYVGIEPAPNTHNFILMSDQHLKCWFLIENLGNTPATNTRINITIAYVSEDTEIPLVSRLDNFRISLLPNKHRKMSIITETPIDDGMKSSILLHWAEIRVSGKIDYDDVYGLPHETHFSFYARGQVNFDENRLSVCPEGNYVT